MIDEKQNSADIASRRGFLKALGAGAALQAAGAATSAPPTAPLVAPVVVLPESRVAGAEKRLSVEARLALENGARLAFQREPDNRWDKRAVRIHLINEEGKPGEVIGYVPRHENTMVCDLLDAGHDIAGELLELERFVIHEKVAPGAAPSPDMLFIEDVKLTEDRSRIIKTECIRPQFRAWIATGQAAATRPPEWFEISGVRDWVRIVRQHKPTQLTHAAHFTLSIDWQVGMEITLRPHPGSMPGWVRYSLHLQDGTQIGDLEGPHHIEVEKACNAGRKVRAIVTEISKQKWTGHNTTPLPLIEIHATC